MKNFLLLLTLFLFGITNSQNKLRYGIKAGLNFSEFRGDLENASVKPGFVLGGLVNYKINNKFAIQPEVFYSSEGTDYTITTTNDISGTTTYTENSINIGYISIPVMVEYYLSKVSFEFGPQISFLTFANLHTNTKVTTEEFIAADAYSTNVKDDINNLDFGLNFGVGYNFTTNFNGNLRYNLGLLNVEKNGEETNYNSVITFSFGYLFN